MTKVLQNVLSRNLEDLHGTHVTGLIPVSEKLINEAANQAIVGKGGRIRGFAVQVGANNYIQAGIQVGVGPFTKWFRPEIAVAQRFLPDSHTLLLTLVSSEYAGLLWLAELFAKELIPQGLTIQGRQMALNLAALPQLQPYRRFLPYLKSVEITTERGKLFLRFELRIEVSK